MTISRAALLMLLALAAACSQAPSAPTTPIPASTRTFAPYEGVWQITFRVADCKGFRNCFIEVGETRMLPLRLVRSAGGYEGVLTVSGANVDVSGQLTADGDLLLTGLKPAALANDFAVEVRQLRLRSSLGVADGAFDYTIRGPGSAAFSGNGATSGPVTAITRTGDIPTSDAGRFDGTWRGDMVVRDCTSQGWSRCYPHEPDRLWPVELILTQSGSGVSGTLKIGVTVIAVTGTASGNTLLLQGTTTSTGPSTPVVARLTTWSATRDLVGRLTGSFAFDLEWLWPDPSHSPSRTTFRSVDLESMVITQ